MKKIIVKLLFPTYNRTEKPYVFIVLHESLPFIVVFAAERLNSSQSYVQLQRTKLLLSCHRCIQLATTYHGTREKKPLLRALSELEHDRKVKLIGIDG